MIGEECVMIVNDESKVYNEYTKAVNMFFFIRYLHFDIMYRGYWKILCFIPRYNLSK